MILDKEFTTHVLKDCRILVTVDDERIHMSISHPTRYPTWDEIKEARYKFVPDNKFMVMVLPPKANYVNVHPFCFHLWESNDPKASYIWNG